MGIPDQAFEFIKNKLWEKYSHWIITVIITAASTLLSWMRNTALTWADVISGGILLILMIWLASVARKFGNEEAKNKISREDVMAALKKTTVDMQESTKKMREEAEEQRIKRENDEKKLESFSSRKEALIRAQTDIDRLFLHLGKNIIYVAWWKIFSERINSIHWEAMNENWCKSIINEMREIIILSINENRKNSNICNPLMRIFIEFAKENIQYERFRGTDWQSIWNNELTEYERIVNQ